MVDREKVIKGLRCLSNPYIQDMDERDCENCQYDNSCCFLDVTADALSLLKAQEPRVMALEEVKTWVSSDPDLRDPIFYEDSVLKEGWWITHDNDCIYLPSVNAGYGLCWTSRPTDEQREATPWRD